MFLLLCTVCILYNLCFQPLCDAWVDKVTRSHTTSPEALSQASKADDAFNSTACLSTMKQKNPSALFEQNKSPSTRKSSITLLSYWMSSLMVFVHCVYRNNGWCYNARNSNMTKVGFSHYSFLLYSLKSAGIQKNISKDTHTELWVFRWAYQEDFGLIFIVLWLWN